MRKKLLKFKFSGNKKQQKKLKNLKMDCIILFWVKKFGIFYLLKELLALLGIPFMFSLLVIELSVMYVQR